MEFTPNQKYGKITLIEKEDGQNGRGQTIWKAKCDCGTFFSVTQNKIKYGQRSCGCNKTNQLIDLSGRIIGRLEVIRISRKYNNSIYWLCKCLCGKECEISRGDLSKRRSCGCAHQHFKHRDLTKEIFESFIVKKDLGIKKKRLTKARYYLCECKKCGKELEVSEKTIVNPRVKSCGCWKDQVESGRLGGQRGVALHTSCVNSAKKRNLEFELTREQWFNLTQQNCYYCGCQPLQSKYITTRYEVLFNGIDRKDNSKGYTLENSVACCKNCNYMKSNLDIDEFFKLIKHIYVMHNLGEKYE